MMGANVSSGVWLALLDQKIFEWLIDGRVVMTVGFW